MVRGNDMGEVRRTIRFFADYGAYSPLWENGTSTYLMSPSDYGLSDSLTKRLLAWAEYWNSHYHWENRWDDPISERTSRLEGDILVAELRKEVADFADVVDER